MHITYGVDLSYFIWSFAGGAVLALIYDIFRTMRRVSRASVFGINAEDMLFLVFAGALMFYIAYTQNNGRLRWHGFLGTVCGFLAFRIIFRDRIVKCMTFVYGLFAAAAMWIIKAVMLPVQLICRMISKPLTVIGWYSRKKLSEVNNAARVRHEKQRIQNNLKRAERERRNRLKTEKTKAK